MFGKKKRLSDLMVGFHDIHSHYLPGVDDGAKDADYAHHLLSRMEALGVEHIGLTPHIINGMYDNHDEEFLRREFAAFENKSGIKLHLAAEYFVDDRLLDHLSGDALTYANKHLLVEFALNSYAINSFQLLFDASVSGYNIILAHPERYLFLQSAPQGDVMEDIINCGYKLQLNLLSLTGYHGKQAQKLAQYLLAEERYDFVGTDTHSNAYIDMLESSSVPAKVFAKLEQLKENNKTLFQE